MALRALLGLMLVGLGLVLLIGFVLLLLWDSYRLPALAVLTLLCLVGGLALLQAAKRRLHQGEPMFAATRAELERDQAALRGRERRAVNAAHEELLRRRERLLLRSAMLRQDWSQQVQVLRAPLGVADQARAATRWLVQHPEWPLGAALAAGAAAPWARAALGQLCLAGLWRVPPCAARDGAPLATCT